MCLIPFSFDCEDFVNKTDYMKYDITLEVFNSVLVDCVNLFVV